MEKLQQIQQLNLRARHQIVQAQAAIHAQQRDELDRMREENLVRSQRLLDRMREQQQIRMHQHRHDMMVPHPRQDVLPMGWPQPMLDVNVNPFGIHNHAHVPQPFNLGQPNHFIQNVNTMPALHNNFSGLGGYQMPLPAEMYHPHPQNHPQSRVMPNNQFDVYGPPPQR